MNSIVSESSLVLSEGLRENKYKLTRPRRAILDIVAQADHHLTPAEVYERAKDRYPHLGLTTVYRTLDLLVELGYIRRIHLDAGCHSYAPAAQSHGHQLVCSNCGRIEEFADCDLDLLIKTLQTRTGYKINVHMLELMGRCPACQGQGAGRRPSARGSKENP
ncbi:MAG: Fur family transcriptional regulator [Anaerolineae bacterium]